MEGGREDASDGTAVMVVAVVVEGAEEGKTCVLRKSAKVLYGTVGRGMRGRGGVTRGGARRTSECWREERTGSFVASRRRMRRWGRRKSMVMAERAAMVAATEMRDKARAERNEESIANSHAREAGAEHKPLRASVEVADSDVSGLALVASLPAASVAASVADAEGGS